MSQSTMLICIFISVADLCRLENGLSSIIVDIEESVGDGKKKIMINLYNFNKKLCTSW